MISKLYNYWYILKSSLWFLPAIFCFFYFIIVLFLYEIEIKYFPQLEFPNIFFSGNAEDAKTVTIALLSSMITMATLAISITIVALSLAASQLGPRLIKTFMSNKKTQTFIGLFFGAVIACFMLTVMLHDAGPKEVNPRVTISFVFTICFANLFVLLAFVHHVAQSIIADNVILSVANDLMHAVSRLTRERKHLIKNSNASNVDWPNNFEDACENINFKDSGYIQNINYDQIAMCAKEHNAYVDISIRSGNFLVKGQHCLQVMCPEETNKEALHEAISGYFIIGNNRTPTQDIEYSIRHLVEIATRALSPGINDSYTALTVLDYLSKALTSLFENEVPLQWVKDEDDVVRLRVERINEQSIIFVAFNQIRHEGRKKPVILKQLLEKLEVLKSLAQTKKQKEALGTLLEDLAMNINKLEDKNHEYNHLKKGIQRVIEA